MGQPTFYQLRTQEQLGYIVKGYVFQHKRALHFAILVQSSSKNADYLEHRINEFLESYTKKEVAFEENDVETVKQALINRLKQKDMSLPEEAAGNWDSVIREETEFNAKEKMLDAYAKVKFEDVNALFMEVFFQNPRRLILKMHSHAHKEETESRKQSKDLSLEFYKRMEERIGEPLQHVTITDLAEFHQAHDLHPRL